MTEPFLGEIRPFAINFAPKGWAMCNGQLLPINQNQALFSILGTTYGGNGQTTFALPDLRSRSPLHWDTAGLYPQGTMTGSESVALTAANLPPHNHQVMVSPAQADSVSPQNTRIASPAGHNIYATTGNIYMDTVVGSAGGNFPFSKVQPYLVLNFCIALTGIFPSRD